MKKNLYLGILLMAGTHFAAEQGLAQQPKQGFLQKHKNFLLTGVLCFILGLLFQKSVIGRGGSLDAETVQLFDNIQKKHDNTLTLTNFLAANPNKAESKEYIAYKTQTANKKTFMEALNKIQHPDYSKINEEGDGGRSVKDQFINKQD